MTKELEIHLKKVVDGLRKAVAEALETKRRLGQYAVVEVNGQPCRVSSNELSILLNGPTAKP